MVRKWHKWRQRQAAAKSFFFFLDILEMEAEINCQSEATLRGLLGFLYAWVYELILKVRVQIYFDVFLDCFAFRESMMERVIYLQSTDCFAAVCSYSFLYLLFLKSTFYLSIQFPIKVTVKVTPYSYTVPSESIRTPSIFFFFFSSPILLHHRLSLKRIKFVFSHVCQKILCINKIDLKLRHRLHKYLDYNSLIKVHMW